MKKPQIIIVTGTPATGKTTIAKRLAKKQKATYIDVNLVIKKYKLVDKYDKKLKTNIVDVNKLNKVLIKIIKDYQNKKQSIIIDSHLSHYLPKKYVDLCIVTKCSLKKLQQRLNKRKYHQQKIRENMDAEILDVCLLEAILNKHKVKVVTT
ncbi:adenylate kinase family protein [Candidatus Woesearchaeota archaeon]|nr:adenylate kinase family protein [Candidatus Woesearchaeota archaeon]